MLSKKNLLIIMSLSIKFYVLHGIVLKVALIDGKRKLPASVRCKFVCVCVHRQMRVGNRSHANQSPSLCDTWFNKQKLLLSQCATNRVTIRRVHGWKRFEPKGERNTDENRIL